MKAQQQLFNEPPTPREYQRITEIPLFRIAAEPDTIRRIHKGPKFNNSRHCYEFLHHYFEPYQCQEAFFVVYLSNRLQPIGVRRVSEGTQKGTMADKKLIIKCALDCMAEHILIAHNHPSGNDTPSQADRLLTKKLKEATSFFDIEVIDHIIYCGDKYFSFADKGIL